MILTQLNLYGSKMVNPLIATLPELTTEDLVLDATAGNRMMWRDKEVENVVFLDKKIDLNIPPDIIGVWAYLPFRDHIFKSIVFDPPHIVRTKGADPRFTLHVNYGSWKNKNEAIREINKAIREFSRLAKKLYFKWCNTRDGPTLWGLLPLFKPYWIEVNRTKWKTRGQGNIRGETYWIFFVSQFTNNGDLDPKEVP